MRETPAFVVWELRPITPAQRKRTPGCLWVAYINKEPIRFFAQKQAAYKATAKMCRREWMEFGIRSKIVIFPKTIGVAVTHSYCERTIGGYKHGYL